MTRTAAILTLLLAALALAPAGATTYVTVADGDLADQAELIVRARVEAGYTTDHGGVLFTGYPIQIEEVIKGSPPGLRLELRVPGGVSRESGRALVIHGVPHFRAGERALLFLRANADGSHRILHLSQGAFGERHGGGESFFVRAGDETLGAAAGERARDPIETVRHGERFAAWLRDRTAGRRRPADYWVAAPPASAAGDELRAAFTPISSAMLLRWFDFDEAEGEVAWFMHEDGMEGLAKGGENEFRKARKAWMKQTGAPIRLTYGGTTASTLGFAANDSLNTILFSDVNGLIGDEFSCETGGVLALGGVSGILPEARAYKGESFLQITEGEIMVNDGVGCLFAEHPKLAAQVFAHELGHSLGLGHACGDSRSPKCSSSDLLDEALMRAFTHGGDRGAALGDDDIAGARYFYDPDFFAALCDLPPGHRKFCKRCGPCGAGQGNCRKTAHCLVGLECAKNVGTDFGMRPKANVCVPPEDG